MIREVGFFNKLMAKYVPTLISLLICVGCGTTKLRKIRKEITIGLNSELMTNQFTGFFLINADTKDTIYNYNGQKYFTPASNTKIFTLYTSLNLLPDHIPAMKYLVNNDTVYVEGTGDPTQLHPYFHDSTAIAFLKGHENIKLHQNNFISEKLGPGWAWDDYAYYYQVERTGFPLYGNVNTIYNDDTLHVVPSHFRDAIVDLDYKVGREAETNLFYYANGRKDTIEVPFRTDSTLTRMLLEEALGQKVANSNVMPEGEKSILYGVPSDSVYRRMMLLSDNFLAEQLLILASTTLSDTLDGARAQKYILDNQLAELQQPPRWVDGSGLSRYNLFTPQSMVHVLYKMYSDIPKQRLYNFFPVGGANGTLAQWFGGDQSPYIFAKSGSLGNNYCLSGYLLTASGKTLIFSFMNNHFIRPSEEIKKQMETIFESIRDSY